MKYEKTLPQDIRFGNGIRFKLPEVLRPGAVLIICGKHALPDIEKNLVPLLNDRKYAFAEPVSPELPLTEVAAAVSKARQINAVNFIGWGGGSAMDCAKAVAALSGADADCEDCFYGRAAVPERNNFLVLLPTSAGTGAEITANAVIVDHATGIKQSLRGPGMTADCALVDPELLQSAPPPVIAASGFDALTQALESFLSLKGDALTRQIALSAAEYLFRSLAPACRMEISALPDVARGSMLAGIAFASSGLGAVHGIGHPAGSIMHIPHGICCAILLPAVLQYNLPACRERFAELAGGLGFTSPEALIAEVIRLRKETGLPENFTMYGFSGDFIPFIVQNCRSGSMKCNPRPMDDEEVAELLRSLA